MTPEEAIELLRSMQNPKQDYADVVCAPAFCTGFRFVYPEPEDYAIEEAISALKEIQQYREMDKKLREAYGDCDGLLAIAVEGLCKHPGINIGEPIKARLLIDEDVDKWDAYREIGTVEECREAVERLEAKPVKNRKILRNFHGNPYGIQGDCPNCGCERITSMSTDWCHVCGQHLKYDENLEGMEGGTGQV